MKVGDVGTELTFTIKDQDGLPVDLTTATSVVLVMQLSGQRVEKQCSIVDAAQGKVRYTIGAGDLFKAGTLYMEVKVAFASGDVYTTSRVSEVVEPVL